MWNAGLIVLSLLAPLSTSASLKCSDYFFLSSDVIDLHRSYLLKIANDPDETAWLPPTVHHSRILLKKVYCSAMKGTGVWQPITNTSLAG